ncbi:hypothetical protein [Paenibacillus lutrae]|uniref:Integrase n=1 Tax=Paenibacillus lutrae TaxID=2078573 RepID=A0A7X3FJA9_9BACL|nr:hypothetical protein [Paenibacillus lutrae]MVP00811.1 hypothetical protein [Paenibacillus lutrae]
MSNQIYEDGFFNEYQKVRYLNTLPTKSRGQAERILSRAKALEIQFQTDLYNFNLDQVEKLFHYMNPSTLTSSKSNFYVVQNYIRWAIKQDLRVGSNGSPQNINPLDLLNTSLYHKNFIDQTKQVLFTKEEVYSMIDRCMNAQDAFPVIGLFEGISGNGYDELLNLNKESLLKDNGLLLHDGGDERFIKVSDKCMGIINEALNQQIYYKKNGNLKETMKSSAEAELESNDYVLKNVKTRSKTSGKADKFLIQRRIASVKEYNQLKVLNPTMIKNSGMLYMAKGFYDRHGELKKEHYDEISDRFGFKQTLNNGKLYYNNHRLKDSFLNVDRLLEVYTQ